MPRDELPALSTAHQPASLAEREELTELRATATVLITHPLHPDRVLLVRHNSSGRYVLPGGKVRAGETAREAAEREGREEIGVPVGTGALLVVNWLTSRASPPGGNTAVPVATVVTTFEGRVTAADADRIQVPADEIPGFAWLTLEQAGQDGWMEPHILIHLRTAALALRQRTGAVHLES